MVEKLFVFKDEGIITDLKNQTNRNRMFVSSSSGVLNSEFESIIKGIEKIALEVSKTLRITPSGNFQFHNGDFGSADWYVRQAMTNVNHGFGPQVSANLLDQLLRAEPYQQQESHFDFFITAQDLRTRENDAQNNFIFGYGPYPNNILSVKRFRDIQDPSLRYLSLAILAAHEFGHNLDLLCRNFNIGSDGYQAGHCLGEKGPCLMEQVNIAGCKSIEEQARILAHFDNWLCEDCLSEVSNKAEALRQNGYRW